MNNLCSSVYSVLCGTQPADITVVLEEVHEQKNVLKHVSRKLLVWVDIDSLFYYYNLYRFQILQTLMTSNLLLSITLIFLLSVELQSQLP